MSKLRLLCTELESQIKDLELLNTTQQQQLSAELSNRSLSLVLFGFCDVYRICVAAACFLSLSSVEPRFYVHDDLMLSDPH